METLVRQPRPRPANRPVLACVLLLAGAGAGAGRQYCGYWGPGNYNNNCSAYQDDTVIIRSVGQCTLQV